MNLAQYLNDEMTNSYGTTSDLHRVSRPYIDSKYGTILQLLARIFMHESDEFRIERLRVETRNRAGRNEHRDERTWNPHDMRRCGGECGSRKMKVTSGIRAVPH